MEAFRPDTLWVKEISDDKSTSHNRGVSGWSSTRAIDALMAMCRVCTLLIYSLIVCVFCILFCTMIICLVVVSDFLLLLWAWLSAPVNQLPRKSPLLNSISVVSTRFDIKLYSLTLLVAIFPDHNVKIAFSCVELSWVELSWARFNVPLDT